MEPAQAISWRLMSCKSWRWLPGIIAWHKELQNTLEPLIVLVYFYTLWHSCILCSIWHPVTNYVSRVFSSTSVEVCVLHTYAKHRVFYSILLYSDTMNSIGIHLVCLETVCLTITLFTWLAVTVKCVTKKTALTFLPIDRCVCGSTATGHWFIT